MKKILSLFIFILLFFAPAGDAGFLDGTIKGLGLSSERELDENTVISGLKEVLSVGTEKAVKNVSAIDGYLTNQDIKILMPEKIQRVADVLKKVGYQEQVNGFITSMNRAAEKAAPEAASYFVDAIKDMTFDDARKIFNGGDTAATDYFKSKTADKLYEKFRPIISASVNEVGVTRNYKKMMEKYASLPFMKAKTFDLDHYVTNKSLDGLFYMVAEEEKKIRTDPAARVTDVLKKVFGK